MNKIWIPVGLLGAGLLLFFGGKKMEESNQSWEGLSYIPKLLEYFKRFSITNRYAQAAALAVISKESNFKPQTERSYKNTNNSRIREIFGSRVSSLSEAQLTALKKDDVKFFNLVYGNRYGNAANEGYKFRGRGFNQITFKANYESVGKSLGIDLVTQPDLLNKPDVAAAAAMVYFKNTITKQGLSVNSPKNLDEAVMLFYRANAGFGKSIEKILADPTGGLKKAKSLAPFIYKSLT